MTRKLATHPHILVPIKKLRKNAPLKFTTPAHFKIEGHSIAKGSTRDYATLYKHNREVVAIAKIRQKFRKKCAHTL